MISDSEENDLIAPEGRFAAQSKAVIKFMDILLLHKQELDSNLLTEFRGALLNMVHAIHFDPLRKNVLSLIIRDVPSIRQDNLEIFTTYYVRVYNIVLCNINTLETILSKTYSYVRTGIAMGNAPQTIQKQLVNLRNLFQNNNKVIYQILDKVNAASWSSVT